MRYRSRSYVYFALIAVLLLGVSAVGAADPSSPEFVPDHLMVQFDAGVDASTIAAVNAVVGGRVGRSYRLDAGLKLVVLPDGADVQSVARWYALQPEVRFAEPDYIYRVDGIPNDPRFGELWGMNNTGQSGGTFDFDIDAPEAWDDFTGGPGIVIGSIDTGVDMNHEDLAGNIWTNPGEIPGNGVDDDGNGYVDDVHGWDFVNNDSDPRDDHDHGTHTMGTAAARGNNGVGVAGVTWTAEIMAIKVCNQFGSCPTNAIVSGIDYATENGANVTSNSYGGGGFSQATYDAIARANAAGILFSAAAGNNGTNNDASAFYPATYDLPNIISVAATDRYGNKSSFSNYGLTTVDLGAPGSSILSTTPNNTYSTFSGTSMACPHVTGAVAYLMEYNPTLDYLDYKNILMQSVEPADALAGRTVSGGQLNLRKALDLMPPINVPPDNNPPVADPGGPYKGRAFNAITFDGSGSYDPDAGDNVTVWVWDFGDGNVVSASTPTVTHTYGPGNNDYVVTLTVKDKYRVGGAPQTTTCRIRGGGRKAH